MTFDPNDNERTGSVAALARGPLEGVEISEEQFEAALDVFLSAEANGGLSVGDGLAAVFLLFGAVFKAEVSIDDAEDFVMQYKKLTGDNISRGAYDNSAPGFLLIF